MSEWQGFSDRELKVIHHGVPAGDRRPLAGDKGPNRGGSRATSSGISTSRTGGHSYRAPAAHTRKQVTIRSGEGRRHASTPSTPPSGDLSRTAFFHPPTPHPPQEVARQQGKRNPPTTSQEGRESQQPIEADGPRGNQPPHRTEAPETQASIQSDMANGQNPTGVSETDILLADSPRVSLEELERQQRDIEAENKKRKALIEQALQERYKKTQVEAKTLSEVKKELDKLDMQVSRDVSILRDKIEEASRQYMVARKRYELAETEFVAAKMELHRSSELKELMSEHLCTVIQQNELRKAKKLGELLRALNVEPPDGSNILPVLFQKTPTPGMDIWPRINDHLTHTRAHSERREGVTQETDSPKVETDRSGDPQMTPPTGGRDPQMTPPTGNSVPVMTPPTGNAVPVTTPSTGNGEIGHLNNSPHVETGELPKPTGEPGVVTKQPATEDPATGSPPTAKTMDHSDSISHTRPPHEHFTSGSSASVAEPNTAVSSLSTSTGESCDKDPSSEESSSLSSTTSDSGLRVQLESGLQYQNHE